ncbi:hypothetical protein BGZ83_001062 [Gryganskiella cystojenkinii]|nr:hypothetical protein BGZ83_001062 [Gryganskiella cystojenkinii]
MTDNRIRLFCVVDRDTSTKAFPVKIEPTETIGELKDAVKTALSRHFNDIDANELILWNFSIPDDGLTVQLNSLRKSNDEQLKGTSTLRDVFGPEKNNKTIRVIVERPPPVLETEEDWVEAFTKIESEFFASAQVNNLHRFVVGPATVPTTSGRLGGLPLIPTRAASNVGLEGRPSLLFLNLPESSAPLDSLSTASKALSKIDSRSVPLMPFFGVSGCGKTRTAIEMLSKRWGFYFNANDADLGSMDLINLVRRLQAKKQRSNEERTLVQILALVLVLSRIMTLEHCLDVAQRERTTFTCKHWMLLQVGFGSMGILDLFANLSGSIASKIQQHSMQIWTMSAIVQNRFSKLQQRLKDGAALPPKILLVIDEAQNLTMDEFRVFGSQFLEDNAASAGKQSLPILSPLIHGLYLIAHDHNMFSVIPCGTGLSLFDMKWLEDSAPAAKGHGTARFTDFRGWESLEQVREYRNSVRDSLPNLRARTIFDSQVPDAPVPMLFQRLRGRYRPIVSAIERMVKSDSGEINWEMAIEEIVNNLTMPELDVKGNSAPQMVLCVKKTVCAWPHMGTGNVA